MSVSTFFPLEKDVLHLSLVSATRVLSKGSLSLSYVTGSVKGLQFGSFAEQVRSGKQPLQIEVLTSDFRYLCAVERKLSIFCLLFIKSCFN